MCLWRVEECYCICITCGGILLFLCNTKKSSAVSLPCIVCMGHAGKYHARHSVISLWCAERIYCFSAKCRRIHFFKLLRNMQREYPHCTDVLCCFCEMLRGIIFIFCNAQRNFIACLQHTEALCWFFSMHREALLLLCNMQWNCVISLQDSEWFYWFSAEKVEFLLCTERFCCF